MAAAGAVVLREDPNGSLAPSWPSSALDEQRNNQTCQGTWYIPGADPAAHSRGGASDVG